ncbi:MAG: hypothetical protein WCT26_03255 [Candidatus Buchananbacteria bacterium]|jgi:hypothetical protein
MRYEVGIIKWESKPFDNFYEAFSDYWIQIGVLIKKDGDVKSGAIKLKTFSDPGVLGIVQEAEPLFVANMIKMFLITEMDPDYHYNGVLELTAPDIIWLGEKCGILRQGDGDDDFGDNYLLPLPENRRGLRRYRRQLKDSIAAICKDRIIRLKRLQAEMKQSLDWSVRLSSTQPKSGFLAWDEALESANFDYMESEIDYNIRRMRERVEELGQDIEAIDKATADFCRAIAKDAK